MQSAGFLGVVDTNIGFITGLLSLVDEARSQQASPFVHLCNRSFFQHCLPTHRLYLGGLSQCINSGLSDLATIFLIQ